MTEIGVDLLLLYFAFAAFGLTAVIYLAPAFLRENLSGWLVSLPLAGMATSLVTACLFFSWGPYVPWVIPFLTVVAALGAIADLSRGSRSELRKLACLFVSLEFRRSDFFLGALFIGAFTLALIPCLLPGYATTPFRFGPDGPLYAHAAHYLSQGTPRSFFDVQELHRTLVPETGVTYPHLVIAAYEVHLRWGCPLLTAVASRLLSVDHPYQAMFLLSALTMGLSALMGGLIVRRFFSLSSAAGWLCAIALMGHAGLLNTLLENQHPNVAFLCFSTVLLTLVLEARRAAPSWANYAFAGLFFAAILTVYSESLPVLAAYYFFVLLLDLLSRNSREAATSFRFLWGSLFFGLIFVAPYTALVAKHLFTLKTGNVGYPQPRWAWPSEIIGLGNVFAGGVYRWTSWLGEPITVARSAKDLRWVAIATALTAAAAISGARRLRTSVRNVWLGGIPVILLVLTVSLVQRKHNYLYTKATIMLAPVLVVGFFAALWECLPSSRSSTKRRWALMGVWTAATFGFGVTYVVDYLREYRVIAPELIRISNLELSRNKIILLPDAWGRRGMHTRYMDRTAEVYELTFPMVQALETIVFCDNPHAFDSTANHRIFRFKRFDQDTNAKPPIPGTILEDSNFAIFETRYQVKDLLKMSLTCGPGLYSLTDKSSSSSSF